MPITGLTCYELNETFECSCNTSIHHLNLLAVYVVIAWIGGTLVTLSMVFDHAGVHDIFFQGLLVILGFMSNTVVASVVFGLILGAIAKWAERSEREEPVEAVEPERVKTYPLYEESR